ncbi:eukaryotic translation initiation factor 4E type 2 [Danaus plexippus]|uniref:Eukaryotic initiation factor 4E-2 n=1 Tax=Danaus plexippus plexippus TaxID=278856 RepID=A0A212EMC8_DANPL|nr:eukaryotic translation initiation factor 4E type 2 [Danaus plexippus]OWR42611.1 eukaryotic initiation factor 4E-2 [Danaus plexippus plexippus]
MTERKMCKFYNLNVPERRSGEPGNQNHINNDEDDRNPDDPLQPYVPPHEHKLEYSYWMWFSRRPPARELSSTTTGYGQALRLVGRVASVEQWWGLYTHLARPAELPPLSDLHLFKLGIKPMWEDPANVHGGKWVVRLRKAQTGRAWEDLCMAMLGEQFMVGAELCGVVLSVRFQEDHLAVWHRTAADTAAAARVRDALRRILQLPASVPIEYKAHGDCLRAAGPAPPTQASAPAPPDDRS